MKYRLTVLIVCASLILAGCSLAEDITPPPGYVAPTPAAALATETPTSVATSTAEPTTSATETVPPSTEIAVPGTEAVTPGAALGNITGNVINGSGGAVPDGQKVTLEGFDKDSTGSYQKVIESVAPVDVNGGYTFSAVEIPQERAFLIITSLGGVEYQSEPVIVSGTSTDYTAPITIYEKTDEFRDLSFNQVHLILNLSEQNVLQVTELFIVANTGKQAVSVQSDGTSIPFIQTPKDAGSVQYQLSQGSAPLLNAMGGFAIIPGSDKQYGFIASYSLPYKTGLKFDQPFTMPVSSLTIFVPQGMRVRGEQLTDAGLQDIQSQSYQMYQTNNMAAGSSLSVTVSGKPGTATTTTPSRQTWVIIGIGIVGTLLIGLGLLLYLRDRARQNEPELVSDEIVEGDALGEDRDSIMDAMIALDDQYKAGEIPQEAYEMRRAEMKERLKGAL
jgi:hypothetical protein